MSPPPLDASPDELSLLLASPEPSARAAAIERLSERGDPRAIAALLAGLDDASAQVRMQAVTALGSLGRLAPRLSDTVERVLCRARRDDASWKVREAACGELDALRRLSPWRTSAPRCSSPVPSDALSPSPKHRDAGAARGTKRPLRARSPRCLGVSAVEEMEEDRWDAYEDSFTDEGRWDWDDEGSCPEDDVGPSVVPEGLLPVNAVAALLGELVLGDDEDPAPKPFSTVLGCVSPEVFARLQRLVPPSPRWSASLPAPVAAFVEHHGLAERLWGAPLRLTTGPELSLVALLSRHGLPSPPHTVDWAAVARWLLGSLAVAPPGSREELLSVVLAAVVAITDAPARVMAALRGQVPAMHEGYLPLLPWLVGDGAARGLGPDGRERARLALCSWLVLRNLRDALTIGVHRGVAPEVEQALPALPVLLRRGGGSLAGRGYPSFRLLVRPSLSALQREAKAELLGVLDGLSAVRRVLCEEPSGTVLEALLRALGNASHKELPGDAWRGLASSIEAHACAVILLRSQAVFAAPFRIRRQQVRAFLTERRGEPLDLALLRREHGVDAVVEGLAHALFEHLHHLPVAGENPRQQLKESLIEVLRAVAAAYCAPRAEEEHGRPAGCDRRLIDALIQRFDHAPLGLWQRLGFGHDQGLPRMSGGRLSPLEQRLGQALREARLGLLGKPGAGVREIELRPLAKLVALSRGRLGRDCSSGHVPLRALSPHHTYYGLFERGEPIPGYLTVFEAFARTVGGPPVPVLCLETVNVPGGELDPVHHDLVVILEAIAAARGLHPRLVLITSIATWNYDNQHLFARSRRSLGGEPVVLSPADPVSWHIYEALLDEARYYSAFRLSNAHGSGAFRLLAPFDPSLDEVQPENLDEARRLSRSTSPPLEVTARTHDALAGFISRPPARPVAAG